MHEHGHDDQASRNARAKAIREAIAEELTSDAPPESDEAAAGPAKPGHVRSLRELTDEAAAHARARRKTP